MCGIEVLGEAQTKHQVAEQLEVEVINEPVIAPRCADVRLGYCVLHDHAKVTIALNQGLHSQIEFLFEFLGQQRIRGLVGLQDLFLPLALLLLDLGHALLLLGLSLIDIPGQVIVDIVYILPFALLDLIFDQVD